MVRSGNCLSAEGKVVVIGTRVASMSLNQRRCIDTFVLRSKICGPQIGDHGFCPSSLVREQTTSYVCWYSSRRTALRALTSLSTPATSGWRQIAYRKVAYSAVCTDARCLQCCDSESRGWEISAAGICLCAWYYGWRVRCQARHVQEQGVSAQLTASRTNGDDS